MSKSEVSSNPVDAAAGKAVVDLAAGTQPDIPEGEHRADGEH